MTVARCARCNAIWVHNCGPRERFVAITRACPNCLTNIYPRVA